MTADRFEKLLAVVTADDKKELGLAHNGKIEAMRSYQNKPGKETKTDLDAARAYYDETLDRLAARYFPEEVQAPEGERFKNKKAAFVWIMATHGNIVSVGKFYQDCGNGNPTTYPDKTVSRFSVLEYVLKLKSKNGPSAVPLGGDYTARREKADTEKAEADVRTATVKADEAERERDAKWMLREDHNDDMAAFAGLAEDIFRHRVYLDHQILLTAAGGNPARAAEFALALQSFVDRGFNDIANYKEIDIEFEMEEADE
ncbi:MAG: hypothetical protein A2Y38_24855 [Spirochaetes bacterium GWB1_59_5]|nr:MAG: hypothetical protein A2Y38_24855 [Spirochaetes bacterium GWB1_59_5]